MIPVTPVEDELLLVVDDQDQPIEPLPRSMVHTNGAWHRVAHIWVVNSQHEILCQQRSLRKDLNPGRWVASFGGHMAPGETYSGAAVRELDEELGLPVAEEELVFWKVYRHASVRHPNNEFQGIFVLEWNGRLEALQFNDGEVEKVAWISAKEAIGQSSGRNADWVNIGYEHKLSVAMGWDGA